MTLLIVTLTSLVSFVLVRQSTLTSNMQDLLSKAEMVSDMIASPGGTTRVLTTRRLEELQMLSDAQLVYVDTDMQARQLPSRSRWGMETDETDFQLVDVIGSLDEALLRGILEGDTATDVRKLDFMDDEVVFAGAPVVNEDGEITGAVILYRPLREISASTRRVLLLLMASGAFSVLVAVILAYVLSRRLTRPLVILGGAAGRMAEGYYGERVAIDSRDEIGQLGMTLNLLSSRLSDVIDNLNEEKTKLENVLSSIGEGIIAIDRDGRVVHHNSAALELLHMSRWQITGPASQLDQQRQLIEMLNASMRDVERKSTSWKTEDGRTIEAVCTPIVSGECNVYGSVCLLRDISKAERLEQMRRDYIANISHELRTPLTGIRGMVEPLMDGIIETDEERGECYRVIYQETMRLQKLIGEMLDMSRLQDGRIVLELEPMQVAGLLEAAARRLRDRAQQGGVRLLIEAQPRDIMVMGDEDRILQVLIILLDNALNFTPEGGAITLFARRAGRRVAVGVRDTGAGIDPGDLPYIWERFYKADKSRMRTTGTGLGLSIAKLVVGLMGGEIGVETEVGKGSTFTFLLAPAKSE